MLPYFIYEERFKTLCYFYIKISLLAEILSQQLVSYQVDFLSFCDVVFFINILKCVDIVNS